MRRRLAPPPVIRIGAAAYAGLVVPSLLACSEGAQGAATDAPHDPLNPAVWIEGGSFIAGSEDRVEGLPAGSPYSRVDEHSRRWTVEDFWIQQHEVTNEEYGRFDTTHLYPAGSERRPAADVTWPEALEYALWLGGSLPTEVQWEYAARGRAGREYPWGDAAPTCERAHYVECEPRSTVVVMTRAGDATPQGVHDLAGNVREWVKPVWFDESRHPVNGNAVRVKGGSWAHLAFFLRAASVTNDLGVDYSWDNIGFRVAWAASAAPKP